MKGAQHTERERHQRVNGVKSVKVHINYLISLRLRVKVFTSPFLAALVDDHLFLLFTRDSQRRHMNSPVTQTVR